MKIEGRTFVISGGSSGLGLACAEMLLPLGAHVAILDIQPPPASIVGPRALFVPCDVSSSAQIEAAVQRVADWIAALSPRAPLGGLVAAAGIAVPGTMVHPKTLDPLLSDGLERMVRINVLGTLELAGHLCPHLIRENLSSSSSSLSSDSNSDCGVIITVSSGAAFDGQRGQAGYAATKGAIASATLPMARDLGRFGIRVVSIAPGIFESPMSSAMSDKVRDSLRREMVFPVREGRGGEFAALVRHVLENQMLNGVVLRLDGGLRFPSRL